MVATPWPAWWNGRHKRLKISGPEGRAGSSPAAGTKVISLYFKALYRITVCALRIVVALGRAAVALV